MLCYCVLLYSKWFRGNFGNFGGLDFKRQLTARKFVLWLKFEFDLELGKPMRKIITNHTNSSLNGQNFELGENFGKTDSDGLVLMKKL